MTHGGSCGPILVVDDDDALLTLVTELLRDAGHAVRATRSSAEAAQAVGGDDEPPALAILDVCLPGMSGHELCRRLRARFGNSVPILFVSGERTEAIDRVAGLRLGGDDYLVKPFAPDELLARLESLLRRRDPAPQGPALTPREREVLHLLAEGLQNREIARRLVISPKTVSTHIAHIYEKLGVRSRVEALTAGYRFGVIPREATIVVERT
jgi:DNA-binding NarL/FixJ family response regulator